MNHANPINAPIDYTQMFFCNNATGNCDGSATDAAFQYEDPGATCSDHVDGNLNHAVEITGHTVSMAHVGTYEITYNCRDLSGNTAAAKIRRIEIVDSSNCDDNGMGNPTITINPNRIAYEAGFIYTDYGVEAREPLTEHDLGYPAVVAYDDVVNTYEIFKDHDYVNCAQIEARCDAVCTSLGSKCPHGDPKRLCNP